MREGRTMCIARNADRYLLLDCAFGIVAQDDDLVGMRLEQGNARLFEEEATHLLLTKELAEKMYKQLGRILGLIQQTNHSSPKRAQQ